MICNEILNDRTEAVFVKFNLLLLHVSYGDHQPNNCTEVHDDKQFSDCQ
jgi:hypothetical protein